MLDLLPHTGVRLPGDAGTLLFGMPSDESLDLLRRAAPTYQPRQCAALTRTDYAELRHCHDAWLSGMLFDPLWNTVAIFGDLELSVAGGGPGHERHLARISIDRCSTGSTDTHVAAAWDGLDLLGEPAGAVLSALGRQPMLSSTEQRPITAQVHLLGMQLSRPTPGPGTWCEVVLLSEDTGWERCCAGTTTCAADGNGLVGIYL